MSSNRDTSEINKTILLVDHGLLEEDLTSEIFASPNYKKSFFHNFVFETIRQNGFTYLHVQNLTKASELLSKRNFRMIMIFCINNEEYRRAAAFVNEIYKIYSSDLLVVIMISNVSILDGSNPNDALIIQNQDQLSFEALFKENGILVQSSNRELEKSENLRFIDTNPDNAVEIEEIDPEVKIMEVPFDPTLISIDTKQLSLDILIKRISQEVSEIELNTENYFQRKANLWDTEKQSRLIESILIRFPLPAFYFDGSDKRKWLVVDGLQRLSSLRNFAVTKTLKLTNLEFLTHLNGKGYDDLERDWQRIIEETQVVAYIINPGTPDDVKYNIFKRINTAGLFLEPQEIRHALNQGIPAKFVAELADLEEFKKATNYSIRTDRMLDRDFVNRFLSFYFFKYENYTPDLDTFMSKAMAHIKNLSEREREKCKKDFCNSMNLNIQIFGENAFRKIDGNQGRKNPLNKALFDVFSVSFAELDGVQGNKLVKYKSSINKKLIELIASDEYFLKSISSSTSDKNRVNYRFKTVKNLIQQYINK